MKWKTKLKHQKSEIALPPATYVSIIYLNQFNHAKKAIDSLCRNPVYYQPKLISTDKGLCSLYEEDAGYQNEDYDAKGKHHRLEIRSGSYEYICDDN
mgnify:CR=1 FL=1